MPNDWYNIKFLESAVNVRDMLKKSTGREPNATLAKEIAVCIQQGRLYFEAAEPAPIQIKPLLLYYGVVAFAQAVIVATQRKSLATLHRAHGLTDTTQDNTGIEDLCLRVEQEGTFQEFNDAIAPLGRIWYFKNAMLDWFDKPFDLASGLVDQTVTILDVLARMPTLQKDFSKTFGFSGKATNIFLEFGYPFTGDCKLRIDDPFLYKDEAELIAHVAKLRTDYPFIKKWQFSEAVLAYGYSVFYFENRGDPEGDTDRENLVQGNNGSFVNKKFLMGVPPSGFPPQDLVAPLSGGYTYPDSTLAMQPINQVFLHEFALQFLGTFMLSTLVRYRPQIWQTAISRSITEHKSGDDRALSLIEKFLDDTLNQFPKMVEHVLDNLRAQ